MRWLYCDGRDIELACIVTKIMIRHIAYPPSVAVMRAPAIGTNYNIAGHFAGPVTALAAVGAVKKDVRAVFRRIGDEAPAELGFLGAVRMRNHGGSYAPGVWWAAEARGSTDMARQKRRRKNFVHFFSGDCLLFRLASLILPAMMDTAAIIDRLGGPSKTATICGVVPSTVTMWKKTGIPPFHWVSVIRFAEAERIDGITFDAIQAARTAAQEAITKSGGAA
jgi:hypothetical protein